MNRKFFKRVTAFTAAMVMAAVTSGIGVNAETTDGVELNSKNFPDEIFRQYVSDNFDTDNDGLLFDSEISQIREIKIDPALNGLYGYSDYSNIKSLKGIEYFTELTDLTCSGNQLTSLDVNNNIALKSLACYDNQLTSLDVSNNTALTFLSCGENQLTSLDVSNNTALTLLGCGENQLTSLDVSNNTALTQLHCSDNQLTSLDVSNNVAIRYLECHNNQFTSLDVSNNTALFGLYCNGNQLTSLDVSNNTALNILYCTGNKLTSLDVSNNTNLGYLECNNNQLTSLDVSNSSLSTWTESFICNGNSYNIGETCGEYELKNLPASFDVTKASNWQGATLIDDKLTEISSTDNITYDYDCGNNHTATFNLTYTPVEHSYDDGVVTIEPTEQSEGEKTYTCTSCGAIKTEVIAKLGGGSNPSGPSQPSQPSNPSTPSQPSESSEPSQSEKNETETNVDVKKGWGNVVKAINSADENSKINVDMGNSSTVPKNVMNAIMGKNIDIVLDMGDGITWTVNGKDVTDPQSLDFSVTKKKNVIPKDVMDKVADTEDTVQLVLGHNGDFGCSATLSIELGDNNSKKIANLYYYNTKTKKLEFVDSDVIVNGKANLVFTHASDWAIVLSDTSAEYEDVSSAAGIYEAADNSQAPIYAMAVIIAALGFSSIIIAKRFAKNKH